MALQVWLPLNGNLTNQGLSEVSVVNSGATTSDVGKIGSCYAFTTSQYMQINGIPFSTLSSCSVAFWIKIPQDFGNWLPFTGQTVYYYLMATASGTGAFYHGNAGSGTIYCDGVQRTTPINDGNWHHYCITGADLSAWTDFYINKYSSGWNWSGSMNDVRIYDHCLSPKEVQDISRGLVLHYKFDDGYVENTTNLNSADWVAYTSYWTIIEQSINEIKLRRSASTSSSIVAIYNTPLTNQLTLGGTIAISGYLYRDDAPYKCTASSLTPYMDWTTTSFYSDDSGYFCYIGSYGSTGTWLIHTYLFGSDCQEGDICYIRNLQFEKKDHATPYTQTSRTSSTVYSDCSGFEHDGTIAGSLQVLGGSSRYDRCTKFSGNEYIDVGTQLYMLTEAITVSCWCKYTGTGIMRLLSCTEGGGWNLEDYNGEGKFNFALLTTKGEYSPNIYTTTVNDGNWHMVTGTFDGRYKKIYTDGVLTGSTDIGATYNIRYTPSVNLYVGRESPSGYNANGCMSDVRIYSTALSEDDILELYNTSAIIDNYGNGECLEAVENYSSIDITKTGLLETQTFIEVYDYLYLPAGTYINTGVHYDGGDSCSTVTTMRYASGGSGRDLMGYSTTGAGCWGTSNGGWELHGHGTYTNSDITSKNTISWTFYSSTENGTYLIGALANTYSVRDKYIYRVKLYKNDVLQLDLYPAKQGDTCGLLDKHTGSFYSATTNDAVVGNDDKVIATFYKDNIELNQLIEI